MRARFPEHTRLWRDVWVVPYEAPDGIWPDDPYHPVHVPQPTSEHLRFAWACNTCDAIVVPPEREVINPFGPPNRVPGVALPPATCPMCGIGRERVWEKPLYIDAAREPSRSSIVRSAFVLMGNAASKLLESLTG